MCLDRLLYSIATILLFFFFPISLYEFGLGIGTMKAKYDCCVLRKFTSTPENSLKIFMNTIIQKVDYAVSIQR